jgi:hypothetical protein
MDMGTFDALTRSAATLPRRASLLALGGVGLAAALSRSPGTAAKNKAKKKCDKQKKQCRQGLQSFCAELPSPQACLDAFLPCCATCNVKNGVLCVLHTPT